MGGGADRSLLAPGDDEADWPEEVRDFVWESAEERKEAALEAHEVDLAMVQQDIERRNSRRWLTWDQQEHVSRVPVPSWKPQRRRARHAWVREDLWRGQHRHRARARTRELDRRAMIAAMDEFHRYDLPVPSYRI